MTENHFVTRTELHEEPQALRTETHEEMQKFRAEMRAEFEAFREEMRRELREAVAALTQRLDRHERWLTVLSTGQVLTLMVLIYVVVKLGV